LNKNGGMAIIMRDREMKLKHKNCVITGAASGIGRCLALGLAREGMNLFMADIEMENLEKVKQEIEKIGVRGFTGRCDIAKYEDFENLAREVYASLGDVDLLINNAGIAGGGFVESLELKDWKRVLDVNLWGIIYSLKVFLPRMLERGSGYIVNTGSGAGVVGIPHHIPYIASKFAVVGISEALYSELSSRGIKVSVICPTKIKTNIMDRTDIAIPQDVITGENQQEFDRKLQEFRKLFEEGYFKGALTPEQVARKYIRGIKKEKLYIFDARFVPFAMFLKAVSQRLYKRVLRRQGQKNLKLIEQALSEAGFDIRTV